MKNIVERSAEVWCPNYPRRCASLLGSDWGQILVQGQTELLHNLDQVEGEYPGYVSTYSFPNGHPTDNPDNIPRIDTLMIDFDFDFDKDEFKYSEWQQKLGDLLTRLRMVAKSLINADLDKYWRASLSGFKGAHLYLDFPPIADDLGKPDQYRNGMVNYTDEVIRGLKKESGIKDLEKYVDVTSGWDLSRLTRLPNTVHEKATEQFNETRYCVPVSIKELANIGINEYVALCKSQRSVPDECTRFPHLKAKKYVQKEIVTAPLNEKSELSESDTSSKSLRQYRENVANDRVELDDVRFLLKRKPCVWEFHKNQEKFDHGGASHVMEMQCIMAMESIGTPIEVMKEFFKEHPEVDVHPRYDETETVKRIKAVLSRDYQEFNCSTILEEAPQFCMKQDCKLYRDNEDLQRIH